MEKDLFDPIKRFFEAQGFVCDGEVLDIDLYMERGEERAAVELKESLDFRAVQQAALRQKTMDSVYIGIFMPKNIYSHSFKDRLYLLKRLGIGLLGVSRRTGKVNLLSEPVVSELSAFQRRNRKKQAAETEEFRKRTLKTNTGGVRGEKLMTGYREDALLVLAAMMELEKKAAAAERLAEQSAAESPGEQNVAESFAEQSAAESSGEQNSGECIGVSVKEIRALSGVARTRSILYDNHYGWFERTGRGRYLAAPAGHQAAEEYKEVLEILRNKGKAGDR